MASTFVPRASFPLSTVPRSYFLGHHAKGLSDIKKTLNSIDIVIECRDCRVPISSRNRLLEAALAGKQRLILYTKHDLVEPSAKRDATIRRWHAPTPVLFSAKGSIHSQKGLLEAVRARAEALDTLTGARILVAGMPNVGKSSILNLMRQTGLKRGKAARVGAMPGVTRGVAQEVRVFGGSKDGQGIYVVDTPGVFIPNVPDSETMLKLALCGCVKDTIIPPEILADYLLYRINLENPALLEKYCEPTNDVLPLLEGVARYHGRLQPGGHPDTEGAAVWLVQRWRTGYLGKFSLDIIDSESLRRKMEEEDRMAPSLNQARRQARAELMRQRSTKARPQLSVPLD